MWVVANFKETQLDQMKSRPAGVRSHAMPIPTWISTGMSTLSSPAPAHVFSMLPAENATGKFCEGGPARAGEDILEGSNTVRSAADTGDVGGRVGGVRTIPVGTNRRSLNVEALAVEVGRRRITGLCFAFECSMFHDRFTSRPDDRPSPATLDYAVPKRRRINPWLIAVTVSMATFMEVLDTSIANVSLRHIAGNLGAGQDESTWVLTSYLVSNAIILPISGWLASVIGRKRFYMTCVALFTVSSLLCGLAPSLGWLIFFRVMQGIGGGGLAPSEQSILADTFAPGKRGHGVRHLRHGRGRRPGDRARRWAAGSPTITPGAGSFSSTFRSAFSR